MSKEHSPLQILRSNAENMSKSALDARAEGLRAYRRAETLEAEAERWKWAADLLEQDQRQAGGDGSTDVVP